ncbi:MAG: ATP-binding protein [Egibacteraceae bacterium]
MTTLRPWRETAEPRPEIKDGSFDESLFAADLGLVHRGQGPRDYLDPITFCEKTYPTTSLRAVLGEIADRLDGDRAAAGVYRLHTEFGGGKTHTLLAAYHLFRDPARVAGTDVVHDLCRSLDRTAFPKATVVVLEGGDLPVGKPDDSAEGGGSYSLLGHIAYQLGGRHAYATVAGEDRSLLGSTTHQIVSLLDAHKPCLILIDELLAYLTKALGVPTGDGNLAATTLTFVKELCTAVANVPGAAVLATLTSSRLEDYADVAGQAMEERLSKVLGRVENIVTPVEGDDIFPILHRRLFVDVGSETDRRAVAETYARYYASLDDAVAPTYSEVGYQDRLTASYPFHPELVDILTDRWGSLDGFQRTRGALRLLSHTVKALWHRRRDGAPLIHVGDVDLSDDGVRNEVLRLTGKTFKSALNADIIKDESKAAEEDRRRGGVVAQTRLATGLATTAFLHSFSADKVKGASPAQMLLGVGRPGLSRGVIDDVRDALEGALWYMRLEGARYRFTTEPNLNKVVLEREGAVGREAVMMLLREAITKAAPTRHGLRVEPRVSTSTDLPDDSRLTLGLLDTAYSIGGTDTAETKRIARDILQKRGTVFRGNRNAAMLVAADGATVAKARASARTLAALRDVKEDQPRFNRFNAEQREQLDRRLTAAEERLPQQVCQAYRHLLLLGASSNGGAELDHVDLGPAGGDVTIGGRVLGYLRNADRLVEQTLAPAALLSDRFELLPSGVDAVEIDTLLGYFARLPRLPKLADPHILRRALAEGTSKGLFGLTSGATWDAEDAIVRFEEPVDPREIQFQPGTFLVRASALRTLRAERSTAQPSLPATPGTDTVSTAPTGPVQQISPPHRPSPSTLDSLTIRIGAVPGAKARDVVKVAVLPLSATGADVTLDVTIRAAGGMSGIPRETVDLVIREGLRQLGLNDVDISEEWRP